MIIVLKDFGTINVHHKKETDGYTLQAGESVDTSLDTLVGIGIDILTVQEIRDKIIDDHLPGWGTLSDPDKTKLIEFHVWASTATAAELDALYSPALRDIFRDDIFEQQRALGCVITKSTTGGSVKFLNWTGNDAEAPDLQTIEPHLKVV